MSNNQFWNGFVKRAKDESEKPHKVVTKTVTKEPVATPKHKEDKKAPPAAEKAPAPSGASEEGEAPALNLEQAAAEADALDQQEADAAAQPAPQVPVDEALATGTGWSATDPGVSWDSRWERFYNRRPDLLAKQDPDVIAKYTHIVEKYPEVFTNSETMLDHTPEEEMATALETPKVASHAAEIAGLSALAVPSAAHLTGRKMKDSTAHKYELAGLGILAAPSLHAGFKKLIRRGK